MNPRPYQSRCVAAICDALETHSSTLAVLATGLGKTVVFSHLAKRWPGRVLVLAHRDELIRQAVEKLEAITGEIVGVEMGPESLDENGLIKPRLVVSSVQTMSRPKRQQKFRPCEFGLVIIDEAHHAVARSYRDCIAHFQQSPTLRLLGVTATPKRSDQLAMGQVFQSVSFDYGIEPAIQDGWLVPVRQQVVTVQGLDFSGVRSVAGDLNEADLEAIIAQEKILHATAVPTIDIVGDLPSLVFCVTVNHAKLLAEVLCRYKPESAVALDGSTPMEVRRQEIERFRRGQVQFLCNCGLFLEGFDAPNTAAVIMARPTKSLALYTQVLGRGTRPLPGIVDTHAESEPHIRRQAIADSAKPSMLVVDFVGNSGRHKIISAADLLGGKYGEPVRQYAAQTAEAEGHAMLIDDQLARAADELALLREIEERKRRAAVKAQAEYAMRESSPFGYSAPQTQATTAPIDPPTEKQGKYLVYRLGWTWEQVGRISRRQASAIIGKSKETAGDVAR